jgi:TolB-like protein/DNA-binding winged helix-turn-helix (wHTH) protein/Tfp pilus assembly protein PilF
MRFGVFEIDLEACELRKSGMRMKLGGQPFQVLQLLVEHPQQVVTRDALKQHLWPQDTHVDYDLALKRLINRLRDTLGDSAESPRYIETIPRIGYRFLAPVITDFTGPGKVDSEAVFVEGGLSAPAARRSKVRFWQLLAAAALLVGVLLGVSSGRLRRFLLAGSSPAPSIRSLAVLPLANLSGDPGQDYFSDGMTDALITDLAQIGSLEVISRTSSMQYKKTSKSLPQIARELKVDGIVEGTVQRSGDRLRITAQLIEGATDRHLWAKSYERDAGEAFVLERDLTQDIAHEIQARLSDAGQRRVASPRTTNPKALDAYLQGLYHLQRFGMGFGDEAKRTAASHLEEAIQADPNFLPAYIQLLHAHSLLYPEKEDFAASLAAAEKAVEIDPASAEAHLALGGAKWAGGAWAEAEQQFRQAVELDPNSEEAHASLGTILRIMGDANGAWNEAQIAQELNPKAESLGWSLYLQGQYDDVIERTLKWRETHLVDAAGHWSLAQVYLQKHMYAQWVAELGAAMKLYGFPEVGGHLQHAFATGGPKEAMCQWAKELEHLIVTKEVYYPGVLAQIYCILGDNDRAFYWLEHAYVHRDRAYDDPYLWGTLRLDPGFAGLRSEPRYKDLMHRIGLPP